MYFGWIEAIFSIKREVHSTLQKVKKMATQIAELATALNDIKALVVEGTSELTSKITELELALSEGGGEIPVEAQTALDDLKGIAQTLADIVPNAPPVEPIE